MFELKFKNIDYYIPIFREIRKRTVRKIIINFCFSLLFLLLTFVFGVDVVHLQWACHVSATLIHMFTLSTFLWMAVQAMFLYKKAVRATKNRGESKKTYQISFFVSWGKCNIFLNHLEPRRRNQSG